MNKIDYKLDAAELASQLIELWRQEKHSEAIEICNQRIEELSQQYAASTLSKGIQLAYRKAIFKASGLVEYRYTEYPVSYFSVDKSINKKLKAGNKTRINIQRKSLISISESIIDSLLIKSKEILENDDLGTEAQTIYAKIVALGLVTGRRIYSEICRPERILYGSIVRVKMLPKNPHSIDFIGQAKCGLEKATTPYSIPVLAVDSNLIESNLALISRYLTTRNWWDIKIEERELQSKLKSNIERAILSHFLDITVAEMGKDGFFNPHDLRKLYAAICHKRLAPKNVDFTAYCPSILGHTYYSEEMGAYIDDTSTSETYNKYSIE